MRLEISRVTDDAEHERALARLDAIWNETADDAVDEVKILAMLVEDYETTRWPIVLPNLDPIDLIKGAMAHAGHSRAHLVELLGSPSRVSEILARKRPLTLDMIRRISGAWGIPQDLLTPAYRLAELEAEGSTTR